MGGVFVLCRPPPSFVDGGGGDAHNSSVPALIRVLLQQYVEKFLPITKVGALKTIKGIRQIDQPSLSGEIENA